MSEPADPAPSSPAPPAEATSEPEWKGDPYLTTGARFRRWNLITLILGLVALGGGWVALKKQEHAKNPVEILEGEGDR